MWALHWKFSPATLKFFNPRVSHGMRPNSYIFEIASSTSICDSGAHSQLIFHSSSSNLFLSNNPVGGATLCRYIGLTDASIKLERQPRNSRAATALPPSDPHPSSGQSLRFPVPTVCCHRRGRGIWGVSPLAEN